MEEIENFIGKKKRIVVTNTELQTRKVDVTPHKHTIYVGRAGEEIYYYLELDNKKDNLFFLGWVNKKDVAFFRSLIKYKD